MEPIALLSVNGSVHAATGEEDLVKAFQDADRSISATTVALLGDHLP